MGVSPVIHLSPSQSHLHPGLQRAGTGALMQKHHVREMETFHVVNPQVVRETLMRKEAGKEHPGLLGGGGAQDSERQKPSLMLYGHPFPCSSCTHGKQALLPGPSWKSWH